MNIFKQVMSYHTNVLEKSTSACRNYIHHSATGDYVRHRTSQQTLANHMQLPSRTLDFVSSVRSGTKFIFPFSLSGVNRKLMTPSSHGNESV